MQRKDILFAINEVSTAIKKSEVMGVLRMERPDKSARTETAASLRALRDYSILASRYSQAARNLVQIFKLEDLENPEVWVRLVGEPSPVQSQFARTLSAFLIEIPKVFALLQQESVSPAQSEHDDTDKVAPLDVVRITFVEDDGQFSTVQRLIEGLSACQEIYDGLQRLVGDNTTPLAIGAIDSGSDKSFDLFGAAALMKEFRELIVSLWGLVVFHREHKLGKRLELLASALPILERVTALEQSSRLGREEAQIIRNAFIDGTKKFVSAGVVTDDLAAHSTYNPRVLLAPEPKLLTGPQPAVDTDDRRIGNDTDRACHRNADVAGGRNLSDADLERLAEIMAAQAQATNGTSPQANEADNE